MGLFGDAKLLGTVSLKLLAAPAAMLREWRLLARSDARAYYEFLGDDVLEAAEPDFLLAGRPLWLNLGYWERAETYADACAALARRLADRARLSAGDRVVDVGFGFAEQDLLWVREYAVAQILGFNVTRSQVTVARERVAAAGLSGRIALALGSAVALPLPDASVDKVVALESAFHFPTRERFFGEAFRVLRPGGCLATADCLPAVGERPRGLVNRLGWRRWAIPRENIYDRGVYRDKLERAGFVDVECESIRGFVFPGMHRYAEQRKRGVARGQERVVLSEQDVAQCVGVEVWRRQGGLTDYALFNANKPGLGQPTRPSREDR